MGSDKRGIRQTQDQTNVTLWDQMGMKLWDQTRVKLRDQIGVGSEKRKIRFAIDYEQKKVINTVTNHAFMQKIVLRAKPELSKKQPNRQKNKE